MAYNLQAKESYLMSGYRWIHINFLFKIFYFKKFKSKGGMQN